MGIKRGLPVLHSRIMSVSGGFSFVTCHKFDHLKKGNRVDVALLELMLRVACHSFLFVHFGNIIQEEVYKSFASEMFMLSSHRLPLLIIPCLKTAGFQELWGCGMAQAGNCWPVTAEA